MAKLPPLPINSVQYGLIKRSKTLPDAENYYRQHLSKLSRPNAEGWANALCPIHGDRNPSLMVNLHIGCFKCMACGASGSNIAIHKKQPMCRFTISDYRTAFNALVSK